MKKVLGLFGILFFMVFTLSACGNTTNTVLENSANNNVLPPASLEEAEACIGYDLPDEAVVIGILQNENYCELSLNIDSDFETMKSFFNQVLLENNWELKRDWMELSSQKPNVLYQKNKSVMNVTIDSSKDLLNIGLGLQK